MKFRLAIGIFLALALFAQPLSAAQVEALADQTEQYQAGELLVKFKDSDEVQRIKLDQSADIEEIIANYENNPSIEYIEPNYIVQATAFPNDPDLTRQWYLNAINIKPAWSQELLLRESENISRKPVIAILDTGVDLDHPDLAPKIWTNEGEIADNGIDDDRNSFIDDVHGWDFVDGDRDANPFIGSAFDAAAVKHGTIVSGVAAAVNNNAQGIAGVGWFAQIMPLRVLDSNGSGDVYSVVEAIEYAIDNDVDVINMSFVGTGFSQSLSEVIRKAYNNDIVVVAAAGNTDPAVNGINLNVEKAYPVCYDGSADQNMVIGVAAVDQSFSKSAFSNFGECIDIAAPGEGFWSTQVFEAGVIGFSQYYDGFWSGTSLSAPLVSGTAAMIRALRPDLTASEVRDIITAGAKNIDVYNPEYVGDLGSGLLDVLSSFNLALDSSPGQSIGNKDSYIVAGLGYGSFPQLKIMNTEGGVFKEFFAYNPLFKGAINIATGDVDGDGHDEVVTGAGEGGGPHIRVFNIEGQVVLQFFAYDASFRGGVNVTTGDVDGDGVEEIIVGAGKGHAPVVKVFDNKGNELHSFLAYAEGFKGGVKVAAGDFDQDGKDEIATGAGAGGGPHVRVFESDGMVISQFFAYNKNFSGGVNIAAGDVHGDGLDEIVATIESNSLPTVRVFNYRGVELHGFFAYEPTMLSGVHVGLGDIDGDGVDEILTGPGNGQSADLKIFTRTGLLRFEISAHDSRHSGGVRPAVLHY